MDSDIFQSTRNLFYNLWDRLRFWMPSTEASWFIVEYINGNVSADNVRAIVVGQMEEEFG